LFLLSTIAMSGSNGLVSLPVLILSSP